MQRDIGNEFIVAIVAVGILAFAVAFAIILSLSGGAGQGATPSPPATTLIAQLATQMIATQTISEQATEAIRTITATSLAPITITVASSTPSLEGKATEGVTTAPSKTGVPTATVVKPVSTSGSNDVQNVAASNTPRPANVTLLASPTVPPTVTKPPSATVTSTSRPSATSSTQLTNTPSLTSTPVPPSATVKASPNRVSPSGTPTLKVSATLVPPSATLTATIRPSATSLPPSATFTATSTPTVKPSATTTKTATLRPSLTPTLPSTATRTATRLPSPTPLPTATWTRVPTKTPVSPSTTPFIVATPTVVTTSAPCSIPNNWISYTVQRGDTFLTIAQQSGTSVEVLQAANCLANINNIFVGQVIYVPPQSNSTPNTSYTLEGCTDAGTQITNLTVGQLISGLISVEGTATSNNFAFYKLEIRPDSANVYTLYNSYIKPVTQGVLGEIDTRIFSPGIYWLKLTVLTQDNHATPSCAVPVLFAQPP